MLRCDARRGFVTLPFRHAGTIMAVSLSVLAGTAGATERERAESAVRPATDFTRAEPFEANPGGATTTRGTINSDGFSHPSANMRAQRALDFKVGEGIFRKLWVSAPSSTRSSDGLGPLFNARS